MVKKVGVFSDLHSDHRNLELIVKTLKQLGVSSTLFLGDAVYKTMADFTTSEATHSYQLRALLSQESPLRHDYLEGLISDEQLEALLQPYETGKALAKKIAKAEYEQVNRVISGFETAVLGGNWDYRDEMKEVFGDALLNGNKKEIQGIRVLGFSGGGSTSSLTAITETFADDPEQPGERYRNWDKVLASRSELDADIIISHLPPSDGEGIQKENGVEHLKRLLTSRKAAGLDTPSVYLHGHRHEHSVVYDEELEAFRVSIGSCSSNHNELPIFTIGEFDDQNRLIGLDKFAIFSPLPGQGQVRLIGSYKLDYQTKKAEFTPKNEVYLQEKDPDAFQDNLTLDQNLRLTQGGLNVDYNGLVPKEKDLLLRRNVLIMSEEIETTSHRIKDIFTSTANTHLIDGDGKVSTENLEIAIEEIQYKLGEEALKTLGITVDLDSGDATYDLMNRSMLINAILGINTFSLNTKLRSKLPTSISDTVSWGSEVLEECQSELSKRYQAHILGGFEGKDWQEMAETYLPSCFTRVKELEDKEAFQFWLAGYKQGIITSDVVEATDAYKKKEGFTPVKRSKKELADKLGIVPEELDRTPDLEKSIRDVSEDQYTWIREGINHGDIPVLKDERGEYLPGENDHKYYLDPAFQEGLSYTPKTKEEHFTDGIKDGSIPVIVKEGVEYLPQGSLQKLIPFDPSEYGLSKGEYTPVTEDQLQRRLKENLLRKKELELAQLREELGTGSSLIAPPSGGYITQPNSGLVLPSRPEMPREAIVPEDPLRRILDDPAASDRYLIGPGRTNPNAGSGLVGLDGKPL